MKKTHYRVRLFPHETETAKEMILAAARHNSGLVPINSVYGLKSLAEVSKSLYKEDLTVEIVGENRLFIDVKFNGEWHSSAIIEEIEVFEAVNEPTPDDEVLNYENQH